MKLNEFFSRSLDITQNQKLKDDMGKEFDDDLFWYILDHDKLHKDYFFPIAKKIKKLKECDDTMVYEMFMPMVVKGCKEFYHEKEMKGKMGERFPVKMREGLCKRMYDHYQDDINRDRYKIG